MQEARPGSAETQNQLSSRKGSAKTVLVRSSRKGSAKTVLVSRGENYSQPSALGKDGSVLHTEQGYAVEDGFGANFHRQSSKEEGERFTREGPH